MPVEKNKNELDQISYLLDLVIDNLNDGFLLISLTGKILSVNQALVDMGGYVKTDLVGKNAMKLANIFTFKGLKKIASSFVDAQKGIPGDRYTLEARTKSGEPRVIEVSNSLIKKDGRNLAIVVVVHDVTVDKKNQDRLNKSEKIVKSAEDKYKILFNTSRDAIMILKPPTWEFISGNQAAIKLFGAKNETEFTNLGPWNVSPKNQPDGSLSSDKSKIMIEKAIKEGSNFFEWVHKKINNQEFPATVLLTKVKIGSELFLQATVRDITEQKKAEQALKEKIDELEKLNKLMVGRELKMVELKEKIKKFEANIAMPKVKKLWANKFQEAVDLEDNFVTSLGGHYLSEIDNFNLVILQKAKIKKLLRILILDSARHENLFKELIRYENEKR
ncbi:MAG: PAS domain-containing protein [Patescibacteria group bacterium]|jgi:PAS domain S-box-containing protein